MTKPPGRRNAELEAWDRELRGTEGAGDDPAPAGEIHPEATGQPSQAEVPEQGRRASPPPDAGVAARGAGGPVAGEESNPPTPATWSSPDDGVTTEVLLRDLIIFQVKLLLDGLKDIILSPLSIAAVLWDLVPSRNAPRGRAFYQILKVGERFDLWLNLYNPSHAQRQDHEGLLEAGVHSADSLMGKLEQLARAEAERKEWQGVVSPPLGTRKPKKGNDLEA